jgi:hypothetical protein
MAEASGTTMTDSIGSQNGTYSAGNAQYGLRLLGGPAMGSNFGSGSGGSLGTVPFAAIPGSSPWSMEILVYLLSTQGAAGYGAVLSNLTAAFTSGFELALSITDTGGPDIKFAMFNTGTSSYSESTVEPSNGWASYGFKGVLTIVWNGSSLQLLVNSFPCSTAAISSWTPGTAAITIGESGSGTASMKGTFSNFSIYTAALTRRKSLRVCWR